MSESPASIPLDPVSHKRSFADRFHNETTAWVVLAVSLGITLISWWLSNSYVAQRGADRFDFEVQKAVQAISKRMQEYEQVLRGGIGLFVSSDEVTREDWRHYVGTLEIERYWPGIQGIGYAQMIAPAELAEHVATIRASGHPDYAVRPPGERDQYSAIVYLEPFSGRNLRAFGYDMFAQETRRAAMSQARDSGAPALSGRVVLVQETEQDVQAGFLMYLPLYRHNLPLDTEEQRRAALRGFVYSPFRAGDLFQGILGADTPYLDFEIYDGDEVAEGARLHATGGFLRHDGHPGFRATRNIGLPGRNWTAVFQSTRELEAQMESAQPLIIGIGGVFVDLLLFVVIWSLAESRRRATEAARALASLVAARRLAASVFDNAREGIMVTDHEARIVDINPMFTGITGYAREDVLGRNASVLKSGRQDRPFYVAMWAELLSQGHWQGEIWNRRADGGVFPAHLSISAVQEPEIGATHYVGLFSDITEQKNRERDLEFLAHHDALTGLPNRMMLMQSMAVATAQVRRMKHRLMVAFLDLDGFKPINDQLGHDAGDEALIMVGNRLRQALRTGDMAARVGGDEFALLLFERKAGETGKALERVLAVLGQPYPLEGGTMSMSASIGCTVYPDDDSDPDGLLRHADLAMYEAKSAGGNRVVRYVPDNGESRD